MLDHRVRTQGDISVYMALLVLGIMVSSALLFTLILSKQLQNTEDVLSSERAFYAADTALERGLYPMSQNTTLNLFATNVNVNGDIVYSSGLDKATFSVTGRLEADEASPNFGQVCIEVEGDYRNLQRRFKLGPDGCSPS